MVGENKTATLNFADGLQLTMSANGCNDKHLFPYIQLYTMTDKPFICVEPWMSFPNAINTMDGVRWLAPQQSDEGVLTLQATTV